MAPDVAENNGDTSRAIEVSGENLQVRYKGHIALDVDRIDIAAGETYVLLGASGAGKSTLLRVLGLLERPDSGVVKHGGKVISRSDMGAKRRTAAVFQKPYLLRGTVGHNVGYGLKLRGVRKADRRERVSEALERVGLAGWETRSALTLSGGEAQRVALARALVLRPSLLLLDEPLSYLDPLLKHGLSHTFAEILASSQVTAFYVTHDREEAAVVADRIGVMRDGRIVDEGAARAVLTVPSDPWAASFLGAEMPVQGTVADSADGLVTVDCGNGLSLRAQSDAPRGSRVAIGVRPEDVQLFEARAEVPSDAFRNRVSARIVEIAPSGAAVRITVESDGVRFAAILSRSVVAAGGLGIGEPVTVLFSAADTVAEAQ